MSKIVRFGGGAQLYQFPERGEVAWNDNFRRLDSAVQPVIGSSGGVDQYGTGLTPAGVGQVVVTFWLKGFENPGDMEQALTDVGRMQAWGKRALWRESDNGDVLYCNARLIDQPRTLTYREFPERRIQLRATFGDIVNPVWLKTPDPSALWGKPIWGGFTWGGGTIIETVNASGVETDATFIYDGIVPVRIKATIVTGGAQVVTGPLRIQRTFGGDLIDEVAYSTSLGNSETLVINGPRYLVQQNNVNAYTSAFTHRTADWLLIEPGSNAIKIRMGDSGDAATVTFAWQEAYR